MALLRRHDQHSQGYPTLPNLEPAAEDSVQLRIQCSVVLTSTGYPRALVGTYILVPP